MPGYRPSPNELERLQKEEVERKRKQRLLQVRHQSSQQAKKKRDAVKAEMNRQKQILAKQLQMEWLKEREEKLRKMSEEQEETLRRLGEGHREAEKAAEELALKRERNKLVQQNNKRQAAARFQAALQQHQKETEKRNMQERQHIIARQAALEQEKDRAAKIAALPPPPTDPLKDIEIFNQRPVQVAKTDDFSTTYYHMPDVVVEKAQEIEQVDGRAAAEEEEKRLQETVDERKQSRLEQRERAQLRFQEALKQEQLKYVYKEMTEELDEMQRSDVRRRQKVVSKMPRQIFLPPHRRLAEKEDHQVALQQAFEDVYMAATDQMGDLSLALEPHPAPSTPSVTDDLELSTVEGPLDSVSAAGSTPAPEEPVPSTQAPPLIRPVARRPAPADHPEKRGPDTQPVRPGEAAITKATSAKTPVSVPTVRPGPAPQLERTSDSILKDLQKRISVTKGRWMVDNMDKFGEDEPDEARSVTTQVSSEPTERYEASSLTQYTITSDKTSASSAPTLSQYTLQTDDMSTPESGLSTGLLNGDSDANGPAAGNIQMHPLEETARIRKRGPVITQQGGTRRTALNQKLGKLLDMNEEESQSHPSEPPSTDALGKRFEAILARSEELEKKWQEVKQPQVLLNVNDNGMETVPEQPRTIQGESMGRQTYPEYQDYRNSQCETKTSGPHGLLTEHVPTDGDMPVETLSRYNTGGYQNNLGHSLLSETGYDGGDYGFKHTGPQGHPPLLTPSERVGYDYGNASHSGTEGTSFTSMGSQERLQRARAYQNYLVKKYQNLSDSDRSDQMAKAKNYQEKAKYRFQHDIQDLERRRLELQKKREMLGKYEPILNSRPLELNHYSYRSSPTQELSQYTLDSDSKNLTSRLELSLGSGISDKAVTRGSHPEMPSALVTDLLQTVDRMTNEHNGVYS